MNLFGQNYSFKTQLMSIADFDTSSDIQIWAATAEDVNLIWKLHQDLSADTIYKRYHSPRVPDRAEMTRMCGLHRDDGRSFIASVPGKAEIVGMAYYIIQPNNPETADVALLVADAYQGQGIGRRLMQRLEEQAVTQGIRFFDAQVLPSNGSMIHLLNSSGRLIQNRLSYGAREMRVQLQ